MKSKKGFTLIELIIAIAIGIMVLLTAYNILFLGIRGHSKILKSFKNQIDIRYAIETTNQAIRFSTVGFAVTGDDFKPTIEGGEIKGLVKPWSYIGLSPDKKSIVHYKYEGKDGKSGNYKMDLLAEGLENLSYDLKFTKPKTTQEDKLIKYILKVKTDGSENVISTEVEAINALHIIDWGDAKNPAIALAYRTEETPEIHRKPVAAMAMVLDTSGSMNNGMNGTTTSSESLKRISILKNTLTDNTSGLFSILEENDVFVSLVPFSNNANMPHKNLSGYSEDQVSEFYNIKTERDTLENMVKALTADGGTNTGDGMRRAHFQLLDFNNKKISYGLKSNQLVKNYAIVLVDGVTTFGSKEIYVTNKINSGSSISENIIGNFHLAEDSLAEEYIMESRDWWNRKIYTLTGTLTEKNNIIGVGKGNELDSTYGEGYVDKVGKMMKDEIDQAFVIGYSNAKDKKGNFYELESLTSIARALNIQVKDSEANEQFKDNKFVFVATDKDSLKKAFENIGSYINEELWQINGPKLNP